MADALRHQQKKVDLAQSHQLTLDTSIEHLQTMRASVHLANV